MSKLFYLACFRDNVGSNTGFHCADFKGYHTNLDVAHKCTLEEAQREFDNARSFELPLSVKHVDALAVYKVDHQHLPKESQISADCNAYVAFRKGHFDGNDVYWLNTDTCDSSLDFTQASVFGRDKAEKLNPMVYIVMPFALADTAKRRTFDHSKVNKRTMVFGAGLHTPDHIKKARRRVADPKTRFNCPRCGKIRWQQNPHDFEGCDHCDYVWWSVGA